MMKGGFLWCPHCGKPHTLGTRFCDATGKLLEQRVHRSELPARKHPLIGTIINGKYEIQRRIGVGGVGEVFEAVNTFLNRPVAIKIVSQTSPEGAARLRREAQLIAQLQHPNICDVYDVGAMPDGSPFIVLERLTGETLEAHLRRERRLGAAQAIELFAQILSGLHQAHAAGIVHRDLKPANVFLAERYGCAPLVKILDFGFAKDVSGRLGAMTEPGHRCGTPAYMSPEQLFGRPLDPRSDLFTLGIMLFEVLTSRHPFAGQTLVDTTIKIARDPTPPLSHRIHPELASIVQRALEKDPSKRPSSALEMQLALTAIQNPSSDTLSDTIDSVRLPRIENDSGG